MKELIFKMTSDSKVWETMFHRYIHLFNTYYESRENKAYFESISNGFLYILPNLETYKRISQNIPGASQIQQILQTHKEERTKLYKDLIVDLRSPPNKEIILKIEVINYPKAEVLPIMQTIFQRISPDIKFLSLSDQYFQILFPNFDLFVDYLLIFIIQIQSQK